MKLETALPGDRLKDKDGDEWGRLDSGAVCTQGDKRIAWGEQFMREADERFGPFTEIPAGGGRTPARPGPNLASGRKPQASPPPPPPKSCPRCHGGGMAQA